MAGKAGVQYATPFAFLAIRFSIVALIFMAVAIGFWIWRNKDKTTGAEIASQFASQSGV